MDKKFIVEYHDDFTEGLEAIELPTREEAEIKQADLADEGYESIIREVRI